MTRYLLRRVLSGVLLVFAVSSAALLLTRLAPGDYATESLGLGARPEAVEAMRARLGLNRPLAAQYRDWLAHAARFDFGHSLLYDRPVFELVPERAANTALLAVSALGLATLIGIPLGVLTAARGRGALPAVVRAGSVVLLSTPPLLMSLMLVFVAARTGWLPVGGMRTAGDGTLTDVAAHMIVPVLALALPLGAFVERLQAQALTDVVHQPFIVAALARGVPRSRVLWRSALKKALGPVASVYGAAAGTLLSGSFVVEIVTAWPGLGRLMLDAFRARDVYLVAGGAAAGSIFLALATILSDAALGLVDPRAAE
jgi:peptide/nickel transport system permease protein